MDVKNILILGHWTLSVREALKINSRQTHIFAQVSIENANFNCNISSSICDFCHIFLNNSFSMRYLKSNDSVKINISSVVKADTSYTQNCCFTHSRLKRWNTRFFLLIISTFWSKRELLKFKEPRQENLFACCLCCKFFSTVSLNYAHTKKVSAFKINLNISLFHHIT